MVFSQRQSSLYLSIREAEEEREMGVMEEGEDFHVAAGLRWYVSP